MRGDYEYFSFKKIDLLLSILCCCFAISYLPNCAASDMETIAFLTPAIDYSPPFLDELKAKPPSLSLESRLCFRPGHAYNLGTVDCTEQPPMVVAPGIKNPIDLVFVNHGSEPIQALKVHFSWEGLGELTPGCSGSEYVFDPMGKFQQVEVTDCDGVSATVVLRSGLWIPVKGSFVVARLNFTPDKIGYARLQIQPGNPDKPHSAVMSGNATAPVQIQRTLEIQSTPATMALTGTTYKYDDDGCASAVSPGQTRWTLMSGPTGLAIDAESGCVSWTPMTPGIHVVAIKAADDCFTANQIFYVTVNNAVEAMATR